MSEVLNYNKITARILDFTQCRYKYLKCLMACYLTRILGTTSDLKGWCPSYMLCGLLSVLWTLPCLRIKVFGHRTQHTFSSKVSYFSCGTATHRCSWPPHSWSHTTTHHSREDSSGGVISSSQRPLPENIQHSQQTSMLPVGFEPTISAGELPQTYILDRAATGTDSKGK